MVINYLVDDYFDIYYVLSMLSCVGNSRDVFEGLDFSFGFIFYM